MKAYLVQGPSAKSRKYCGSMAAVREAKSDIVEAEGCKKKDITHEEVEIPTSKNDLLDFINGVIDPL